MKCTAAGDEAKLHFGRAVVIDVRQFLLCTYIFFFDCKTQSEIKIPKKCFASSVSSNNNNK